MKIALRIETFLACHSKIGHYGIYDIFRILIAVTLRRSGSCTHELKQSSRTNIKDRPVYNTESYFALTTLFIHT